MSTKTGSADQFGDKRFRFDTGQDEEESERNESKIELGELLVSEETGEWTFSTVPEIMVSKEGENFVARDFKTGIRSSSESRGHAISLLGSKIMRAEQEKEKSSLFELVGTMEDEEADEAKRAIEEAKSAELSKTSKISLDDEDDE